MIKYPQAFKRLCDIGLKKKQFNKMTELITDAPMIPGYKEANTLI